MSYKCSECGADIPHKAKFCPECGKKQQFQNFGSDQAKSENAVAKGKLILSGYNLIYIVALVAIVITGIYGYRYVTSRQEIAPHSHDKQTEQMNQQPAFDQNMFDQLKSRLNANPTGFEEHIDMGNFLFDSRRYDDALTYYQKALEVKPNATDVLVDAGVSHFNMQRFEEAKIYFNKALAIDDRHPNALYNLGVVSAQMGDMSAMLEFWEKLIEIAPESAPAQKAKQMIGQVRTSNPENN